ncbi:alpha/beta hydrolase family protein [Roseomonas sp. CCTCC AB2023176]|uniref:alpha/beta hydrolase family protein n=1 Tax=Roseomonas sp. CCTCC AB2023176 TaxID=3342640 RepID=UPI0035D67C98
MAQRAGRGSAALLSLSLVLLSLALLSLVACASAPLPTGSDIVAVPVTEADGTGRTIPARLCRPTGGAPARLVVVNHGSPGTGAEARARYGLLPCTHEVARWFTARGYAVLAPLRRGYGADRGPWSEAYGACESPDYARGGRETARDIAAGIAAARTIPGLRQDGIVVLGQSAGGWGALAVSADPLRGSAPW